MSDDGKLRVIRSADGKTWEAIKNELFPESEYDANETALAFGENDIAYCLLRRDEGHLATGLFGVSFPPYSDWKWQDTGIRIGGPELILLPDGRLLTAVRLYEGEGWHPAHTSLGWIDRETGRFSEALRLPSGGDTSYPGLVLHEGLLWVSYYSSHQGKTAVYLAKVKIDDHNNEPAVDSSSDHY